MQAEESGHSPGTIQRAGHGQDMASRSASLDPRTRSEDSWVEITSQPSSSSLSSIGEEIVTTGLRVQNDPRSRRRRALRDNAALNLGIPVRATSTGGASSQEEYDESESESDRIMTSSNEGPVLSAIAGAQAASSTNSNQMWSDNDDENRTAVNYPIRNQECFTPQPNAFTHPPSGQLRTSTRQSTGSYFPTQRRGSRPPSRPSLSGHAESRRQSHVPQNILSPSYDAAAQHDEALRTSLSTLLSCAAAARSLGKSDDKRTTSATATPQRPRNNRIEPMSFRLVQESALPPRSPPQLQEPTFHPTIRRQSTSTSDSSEQQQENKRKATTVRGASERRALKKARRTHSSDELYISPTLLTWVVSAGVVVFFSALSFSAGYSLGRESGKLEAASFAGDEQIRSCAREAGRSSLGLKRSLARSAVQV